MASLLPMQVFLRCCLFLLVSLALSPARALTVTVKVGEGGNYFVPDMFTIDPGDTVRWIWVSGHHNSSASTRPAGAAHWYSNITSTDPTYSYVALVSGLYTYTCTHHSGMDGRFFVRGCSYPDMPVISSDEGDAGCSGDSICLRTARQAGVSYQWIDGVVTIPGATSDSLWVHGSGNYKVTVNRCGADSVSAPFPVTIHSLPHTAFTYSGAGLSFSFINASAGHQFTWSFSDGSPDQHSKDAHHSFATAGRYRVTLRSTDTITCFSDTTTQLLEASLGIPEATADKGNLFPNPTSGWIQVPASEDVLLVLYDQSGKPISVPQQRTSGSIRVDLRSLPAGLYLVGLSDATGSYTEQVMVLP